MKNFKTIKFFLAFLFIFLTVSIAFAQVDVARQTTAVTYPLDEVVYAAISRHNAFSANEGRGKNQTDKQKRHGNRTFGFKNAATV